MPNFPEALGIDFGSHSIKVVYAKNSKGRSPELSSGWVKTSDDPEDNLRLLRRFLEKKGWEDIPALITIGSGSLVHRTMDLKANAPINTVDLLQREKLALRGMSSSEGVHDELEISGPGQDQFLFVSLTREDVAQEALSLADQAGLNVVGLKPPAIAIFNAVTHLCAPVDEVFFIVDLGHHSSLLIAGYGDQILFARRFNGGAENFPQELRMPRAMAGSDNLDSARLRTTTIQIAPEVFQQLDENIADWCEALDSCMGLYRSQFAGAHYEASKIFLSGGGVAIGNIAQKVELSFGLPVEMLDELEVRGEVPGMGRFSAAVGLALAGVGRDDAPIDLLPADRKVPLYLEWQRPLWTSVCALLVLSGAVLVGSLLYSMNLRKHALEIAETEIEAVTDMQVRLQDAETELGHLESRIVPLRESIRNGHVVRKIFQAIDSARHEDDWILLIADAKSYEAQNRGVQAERAVPSSRGRDEPEEVEEVTSAIKEIIVEGYTPKENLSSVRKMLDALREYPEIASADLLSDDRLRSFYERDRRWNDMGGVLFALEIAVEDQP